MIESTNNNSNENLELLKPSFDININKIREMLKNPENKALTAN
jgi:hypothetical protein